MTDFARARENMVNAQLMTNGIHNKDLLEIYRNLPREAFLDKTVADRAYVDEDLSIPGQKAFVLEPLAEARLLQDACAAPVGCALVLGAASLPSAVIMASCASTVIVLEPEPELATAAQKRLSEREICNTVLIEMDYRDGYARQAPYDVIFVPGAVPAVPQNLIDQLSVGGKLLCVLRPSRLAPGKAVCLQRLENGDVATKIIADVSTPYLPGFEPGAEFSF
ncbi:MAG TPA: protein-L-isoaspartate O-methyltransferase [Alphaproteobacteria bacterium]